MTDEAKLKIEQDDIIGEEGLGPDEAQDEAPADESPELASEQALAELQDRYLRLAAEFENYRKRTRDELAQSAIRAQGRLVASLLEAVDDFQRIHALDSSSVSATSVLEGVALVERKLMHALEEAGLAMLNPAGAAFDPNTMEALLRVPTADPAQDDMVDQVLQPGAHFHDLLLRPARVSVRKLDT
jgi:molecular chaperone GrpE